MLKRFAQRIRYHLWTQLSDRVSRSTRDGMFRQLPESSKVCGTLTLAAGSLCGPKICGVVEAGIRRIMFLQVAVEGKDPRHSTRGL